MHQGGGGNPREQARHHAEQQRQPEVGQQVPAVGRGIQGKYPNPQQQMDRCVLR